MSDLVWTPVKIKLGQIQPWTDNPRMSTKAQAQRLIKSERRLGQIQTLAIGPMIDGKYPLYDGHQRVSSWLTVKTPDFEVMALQSNRPLTDDERREVAVLLHTATGSWDWNALSGWSAADLREWGMDKETLSGWNNDANNLKELLSAEQAESADAEPQIEEDRFEEVANKWKTETGQLWMVGSHFVYCGDSLNKDSSEIVLQGRTPALVLADPPYGVNIVSTNVSVGGGESAGGMLPFGGVKNRRGTVGASKPFGSKAERGSDGATHIVSVGKYPSIIGDEDTQTAVKSAELYQKLFPDAFHVWWGANYYIEALSPSPCWIVWNKETTGNFADCELAWTNAEMSAKIFTHRWNGMLRDSERERRWHPTQKPAALAEYCYGLFTKHGEVVLDPFGGAGWSLIGAQKSERRACVIEKSNEYVAVILERMSTAFPELEIKKL